MGFSLNNNNNNLKYVDMTWNIYRENGNGHMDGEWVVGGGVGSCSGFHSGRCGGDEPFRRTRKPGGDIEHGDHRPDLRRPRCALLGGSAPRRRRCLSLAPPFHRRHGLLYFISFIIFIRYI